jgi:hypothetical protein
MASNDNNKGCGLVIALAVLLVPITGSIALIGWIGSDMISKLGGDSWILLPVIAGIGVIVFGVVGLQNLLKK